MGGRGNALSFSPGGGGGSFGPATSLSELTPKTINQALGEKGKKKSVTDALKNVNPFYSRAYSEYSHNCQRCVVAYELRRRGYDVEAQPTFAGDTWNQVRVVGNQRYGRWRGAFRNAVTENVGARGNSAKAEAKVLDNLREKMKSYGPGARAVVNIQYRGQRNGHVFNVENQGGQISFIDAQTGTRYNTGSMRNLLHIVETKTVGLTRTDNLRVSSRVTNLVWQNHNTRNK